MVWRFSQGGQPGGFVGVSSVPGAMYSGSGRCDKALANLASLNRPAQRPTGSVKTGDLPLALADCSENSKFNMLKVALEFWSSSRM